MSTNGEPAGAGPSGWRKPKRKHPERSVAGSIPGEGGGGAPRVDAPPRGDPSAETVDIVDEVDLDPRSLQKAQEALVSLSNRHRVQRDELERTRSEVNELHGKLAASSQQLKRAVDAETRACAERDESFRRVAALDATLREVSARADKEAAAATAARAEASNQSARREGEAARAETAAEAAASLSAQVEALRASHLAERASTAAVVADFEREREALRERAREAEARQRAAEEASDRAALDAAAARTESSQLRAQLEEQRAAHEAANDALEAANRAAASLKAAAAAEREAVMAANAAVAEARRDTERAEHAERQARANEATARDAERTYRTRAVEAEQFVAGLGGSGGFLAAAEAAVTALRAQITSQQQRVEAVCTQNAVGASQGGGGSSKGYVRSKDIPTQIPRDSEGEGEFERGGEDPVGDAVDVGRTLGRATRRSARGAAGRESRRLPPENDYTLPALAGM